MFQSPRSRRARRLAFAVAAAVAAMASGMTPEVAAATAAAARAVAPAAQAAAPAKAASVQASTAARPGYWMGASDGGVYAFGTGNLGQVRPAPLNRPIVGLAGAPKGGGYWLVASDGGVFSYGVAGFHGSTGNVRLSQPVVGMAATPSGKGYWLVAADGGIFDFGDAGFYGSTGNIRLNKPIVGMAATPDGRGYWLVASDGGIFDFGDARFYGSTGNIRLNKPIVGMAATSTGNGYWLVASDGGIFDFGAAPFSGSTGNVALNRPIVGMAASPTGGYWLVASDGGLFDFGGAPYLGSTGADPGPAPIVGIAATAYGAEYPAGMVGTDVSFPNCSQSDPFAGNPVSIVGVNDGRTFTDNPCFAAEAAKAGSNLSVYINVNQITAGDPRAMSGPAGSCATTDLVCQGYNWGYNSAQGSVVFAHDSGYRPQVWWLDVEGPCYSPQDAGYWLCYPDQASNAGVIRGAIDDLHANGLTAGIYSTYRQWPAITGGTYPQDAVNFPGIPIWIATVPDSGAAWPGVCTDPTKRFADGTPWLVQWLGTSQATNGDMPPTYPLDSDYACAL